MGLRETAEILFKFAVQGDAGLGNATAKVKEFEGAVTKGGVSLGNLQRNFLSLIGPIGTATTVIAGVGYALHNAAASAGRLASEQQKVAESTGSTRAEVAMLQAVATRTGQSLGSVESTLSALNKVIADTGAQGVKARSVLDGLGISTRNSFGGFKTNTDLLKEFSEALLKIESSSQRARVATSVLGGNTGFALLKNGLKETIEEVEKLGATFDKDGSDAALRYDDSLRRLEVRFTSLANKVKQFAAEEILGLVDPEYRLEDRRRRLALRNTPMEDVIRGRIGLPSVGASDLEQTLTDRENYRKRLAEENKKASEKAAAIALRRAEEFRGLLDGLDQRGLDPLAQLIATTQNRLASMVREYGSLTMRERASIASSLSGGVRRMTGRRQVETVESDLSRTIFNGIYAPVAQSVDVDPARNQAAISQIQERAVGALQRFSQYQERITALTAGPGGEIAAIERIANIRLQTAEREFAITKDRVRYESAVDQARMDRTIQHLEMQRRQFEEYKQTAGQIYRSLRQSGMGGLQTFVTGQFDIQGQKLFENVSGKIFQSAGGTLGRIGKASGLPDWLLSGTLFDPQNGQQPIDKNTASHDRNTEAVSTLTRVIAIGRTGEWGASGIPLSSSAGSLIDILKPSVGSSGRSGLSNFMGGLGSVMMGGGLFGGLRGDRSVTGPGGVTTTASALGWTSTAGRIGNLVGTGAALGMGTMGVIGGIREGGARGTTTAIGSALGMSAAIPGPQQPFVMAAALIAGMVRGMIPDPKEVFAKAQESTLNSRRYTGPDSINSTYDYTTGASAVDYDWKGRTRVIVQQHVTLNIDALDAKSLEDRGFDLASAIGKQVSAGHPFTQDISRMIFQN